MFCILSFLILSILGIFSSTHRQLAKEAWKCVIKRATLRPCDTGFNTKVKNKIGIKILKKSDIAAKIFYKYFEIVSFLVIILFFTSLFYFVKGLYNFYMFGSCNGLNDSGFCVFDPSGNSNKISSLPTKCSTEPINEKTLNSDFLSLNKYPKLNNNSKNEVIFIGCYSCEYTRKTYPVIQNLYNKYNFNYTFIHFPVKGETDYLRSYEYCLYKQDSNKYWELNKILFNTPTEELNNSELTIKNLSKYLNDFNKIKECAESEETKDELRKQYNEVYSTGIYGTPTIFINKKAYVGPKPERVYKRALGIWW